MVAPSTPPRSTAPSADGEATNVKQRSTRREDDRSQVLVVNKRRKDKRRKARRPHRRDTKSSHEKKDVTQDNEDMDVKQDINDQIGYLAQRASANYEEKNYKFALAYYDEILTLTKDADKINPFYRHLTADAWLQKARVHESMDELSVAMDELRYASDMLNQEGEELNNEEYESRGDNAYGGGVKYDNIRATATEAEEDVVHIPVVDGVAKKGKSSHSSVDSNDEERKTQRNDPQSLRSEDSRGGNESASMNDESSGVYTMHSDSTGTYESVEDTETTTYSSFYDALMAVLPFAK